LVIARSAGDESVCLAAAAYFKNIVMDAWTIKTGRATPFLLGEDTKEACKQLLVPAVVETSGREKQKLRIVSIFNKGSKRSSSQRSGGGAEDDC
jgi:hypothetical protein